LTEVTPRRVGEVGTARRWDLTEIGCVNDGRRENCAATERRRVRRDGELVRPVAWGRRLHLLLLHRLLLMLVRMLRRPRLAESPLEHVGLRWDLERAELHRQAVSGRRDPREPRARGDARMRRVLHRAPARDASNEAGVASGLGRGLHVAGGRGGCAARGRRQDVSELGIVVCRNVHLLARRRQLHWLRLLYSLSEVMELRCVLLLLLRLRKDELLLLLLLQKGRGRRGARGVVGHAHRLHRNGRHKSLRNGELRMRKHRESILV